jgi:putative NADPH-quinone reductase
MNVLLLLAHPRSASCNHALAHAAREQLEADGHRVVFHDLHAARFDPVIPPAESARAAVLPPAVAAHCADLAAAEGVVVVHPNWWGQPPAVLKGWIDRVVRPGVAYEFLAGDSGEGVPRGLLKARTAVVLNTSNTAPEREQAVFGDPLDTLWRNCVFGLCGVEDVRRRTFGVVVASTAEQRRHWLAEARALVSGAFANR